MQFLVREHLASAQADRPMGFLSLELGRGCMGPRKPQEQQGAEGSSGEQGEAGGAGGAAGILPSWCPIRKPGI